MIFFYFRKGISILLNNFTLNIEEKNNIKEKLKYTNLLKNSIRNLSDNI